MVSTHANPIIYDIKKSGTDFDAYTTVADTYATVYTWSTRFVTNETMDFTAATKDLTVKVLGSLDGTTFGHDAVAEFNVTAGSTVSKTLGTYYPYLRIQVKPSSSGQNGTLSAILVATNLGGSSTGGSGGGAATIADGADVAQGTTTDAPYVGAESATARTVVSLLKGIKNTIYGALIAGVSITTGYNQVVKSGTTAGPSSASGAYTIGDRVGPATGSAAAEIANMGLANGRGGNITMLRLSCNKKSVTPVIRVHFFNASDPTISADNAAWKESYADLSKRVGYYDLPAMTTATDTANTDCSRTQDMDVRIPYLCGAAGTSLYYALELVGGTLTLDNGTEFTLVCKAELN
jgi:hypothetical protein